MEKLERIGNRIIGSSEYASQPDTPDVKTAYKDFAEFTSTLELRNDDFLELESLLSTHGMFCENQGFINGFRYAIQIMTDCLPNITKVKVGETILYCRDEEVAAV